MRTQACACLLLLALLSRGEGRVLYVHPDSSLSSIQEGLNLAVPGDTVLVAAGVYYESISWPSLPSIKLFSESGASHTVIDACGASHVITFDSYKIDTTTVVRGFTLRHAYSTQSWGGGVCIVGASPIIEDCIICDNYTSSDGGGVLVHLFCEPIIRNNIITANEAECGGGVAANSADPLMIGNLVYGNHACYGGGIMCYKMNRLVANNSVWGNTASEGGGIFAQNSVLEIRNNQIRSNCANYGGGLFLSACSAVVESNAVTSNEATVEGGGIYVVSANCVFRANSVAGNNKCGMYSYSDTVDARKNWWGSPTGPYHPALNPSGQGDTVGDRIDFIPWLTEPTLCGDTDGDGQVTPGDGFITLNYLGAGPPPLSCWCANADGEDNLTPSDGYAVLNYLGSAGFLLCAPCSLKAFPCLLGKPGPNPRLPGENHSQGSQLSSGPDPR